MLVYYGVFVYNAGQSIRYVKYSVLYEEFENENGQLFRLIQNFQFSVGARLEMAIVQQEMKPL